MVAEDWGGERPAIPDGPMGIRYGKFCGVRWIGCPGKKPCDELDACCKAHDDGVEQKGLMSVKCYEKFKNYIRKVKKSGKDGFSKESCPYETPMLTMIQGMDIAILFSRLGGQHTDTAFIVHNSTYWRNVLYLDQPLLLPKILPTADLLDIKLAMVFDGHVGVGAASFVRKNILRYIIEDGYFPNCMEKAIKSAFLRADHAFADAHSGTTALTALLFGRSYAFLNLAASSKNLKALDALMASGINGLMSVKCYEKFKNYIRKVKKSGKDGFSKESCPYETPMLTMIQGMDIAILFSRLGGQHTDTAFIVHNSTYWRNVLYLDQPLLLPKILPTADLLDIKLAMVTQYPSDVQAILVVGRSFAFAIRTVKSHT
ncbi:hypothetical protein COCNU_09G005780 [Cocos nucifera]|uniref:protein-serine/threonine phosphatase n=1 Tax=Cocos nucifera TaxID=13894 RepID=A0A8K0IK48_COCNU|nr:hypothetical protein COCNU_09G005780 [Cocos nucifera]